MKSAPIVLLNVVVAIASSASTPKSKLENYNDIIVFREPDYAEEEANDSLWAARANEDEKRSYLPKRFIRSESDRRRHAAIRSALKPADQTIAAATMPMLQPAIMPLAPPNPYVAGLPTALVIPSPVADAAHTTALNDKIDEGVERMNDNMESKLADVSENVASRLQSVDESVASRLANASENVESKINAESERMTGRLNEGLDHVNRNVEERINEGVQQLDHKLEQQLNRQMAEIEQRLGNATDSLRRDTNDTATRGLRDIETLNERNDRIYRMLNDTSSVYYDNMRDLVNVSHAKWANTSVGVLGKLREHIDSRLDELQRGQECTVDSLFARLGSSVNESAIMERLNCSRTVTEAEKKARDVDLLSNLDLRLVVADEADPSKSKIVSLTPLVLARRLRGISSALNGGKGLVSVCYHNEPSAFTADHPLAPTDSEAVRKMFNGAMDAAHDPDKGLDLNVPNYVNALILELKNTNRDHVSLCVERSLPDEEYENPAKCLNMIVKRKEP